LVDFLALWKYGKLPLVSMEKPFTTCGKRLVFFHQVCKQLAHSLAILAVYIHYHNICCGEIYFSYRNRNPFMLKLKYIL